MKRLHGLLETGRIDPTLLTTHRFQFGEIKAFSMMETREDSILEPTLAKLAAYS